MICVECTNPDIKCLYSKFKNQYIKLIVCSECGNLADKYIEFDNVLLFLDVLLLKPQAYRHVAYNLVEQGIFGQSEGEEDASLTQTVPQYRQLARYFVLSILFEVYLKWANEEKNEHHSLLMDIVLEQSNTWQYLFFISLLLVERVTLCLLLCVMYRNFLLWGKKPNTNLPEQFQKSYYICVLIVAILMSLIVKCLPIMMLIWPYDNASVASTVVDVVGVFNTIEALKIITNSSYLSSITIVAISAIVLVVVKYFVLSYLVASLVGGVSGATLFRSEYIHVLSEISLLRDFAVGFI